MTVTAGHAEEDGLEEVGLADLRNDLGRVVDQTYYRGKVVAIRRHNRRVAMLIPVELWEKLLGYQQDGTHPSAGGDGSASADAA